MKHPRAARILAMSLGAAVSLALIGHLFLAKGQANFGLERSAKLENSAKHRFVNDRGLSPCDGYARQTLRAARGRLLSIGDSNANLIAVVAPTFSEIELVAFGNNYIRSYRFLGQTGFSPPSAEWFSPEPQKLSELSIATADQIAITTPMARHIRYAMTAKEYGRDGVSYYFGIGEDGCAFAWTPRGPGPGGLIADMIAEASERNPSTERLLYLARAIDDADSAR